MLTAIVRSLGDTSGSQGQNLPVSRAVRRSVISGVSNDDDV